MGPCAAPGSGFALVITRQTASVTVLDVQHDCHYAAWTRAAVWLSYSLDSMTFVLPAGV